MRPRANAKILLVIAGSFIAACGSQEPADVTNSLEETPSNSISHESEFSAPEATFTAAQTLCGELHKIIPGKTGVICPQEFSGEELKTINIDTPFGMKEVSYENIDGLAITEGDIILGNVDEIEGDVSASGAATLTKLWPNGEIPVVLGSRVNRKRVIAAIKHWHDKTGIRFVQRTNQRDYVYFTPGGGCSASLGRKGGKQNISISNACSTGNIIHELGHTVGLWHEQSRTDRERYINIHWSNIRSGYSSQFSAFPGRGNANVGAYDYNSIMHYGSYAFSRNGRPTITKKGGGTIYGQRRGLSQGDIDAVRKLYNK